MRARLVQKKGPSAAVPGRSVHWASGDQVVPGPGILKRTSSMAIKDKPTWISSGSESALKEKKSKSKKKQSVGNALLQAVALRAQVATTDPGAASGNPNPENVDEGSGAQVEQS